MDEQFRRAVRDGDVFRAYEEAKRAGNQELFRKAEITLNDAHFAHWMVLSVEDSDNDPYDIATAPNWDGIKDGIREWVTREIGIYGYWYDFSEELDQELSLSIVLRPGVVISGRFIDVSEMWWQYTNDLQESVLITSPIDISEVRKFIQSLKSEFPDPPEREFPRG